MKELEDQDRERQNKRKLKEQKDIIEDDQLAKMRKQELEAARKRLQDKRDELKALIEKKAKDREDQIEEEKQRLYKMEKDMMERH